MYRPNGVPLLPATAGSVCSAGKGCRPFWLPFYVAAIAIINNKLSLMASSSTHPTTVFTEQAPAPIGPYSQGKVFGNLLFTAGQIGLTPAGELADGLKAQTRQALANLKAVLEAGGASFGSVVKTTIFLKDMNDFGTVNSIYAEAFGDSAPARSTVQAARLPKDALVEIEAIAAVA